MGNKEKIGQKKSSADENSQDSTIDYSNVFTFGKIIRMPIDAVVDASIEASKKTYRFIKEFGFEKDPKSDEVGSPKMLRFFYRYNNAGIEQKMVVEIPILSLITLPFLNITKAKFDVGIDVLNHFVTKKKGVNSSPDDVPSDGVSEIFVLLGPVEKKGAQKIIDKEDTDLYKESRITTNMQASMEVETMDMPSGILKMLNLLQDASSGKGRDIHKLHCKADNILFKKGEREHVLTVTITKNGKPQPNVVIQANVVSNTNADLESAFSKPIKVRKGLLIGNSTLGDAKALSDKNGRVKFIFKIRKKQEEFQNGFIYFSTIKASKIAVYFRIEKSKENEQE